MKAIFLLYLSIVTTVGFGQNVAKIDSGFVDRAEYRIFFPEKWQNKLVMFAHGYDFMGAPPFVKQPYLSMMFKPYLDRGYAVAASNYQYQGFALPRGVDDTEALRRHFYKKYGKPDTTLFVGVSMGGGIALATMENYSQAYGGALALCPLSSRPYLQCRKEFEIYAVFNAFFPGVVPSLSNVMDPKVPYTAVNMMRVAEKAKAIREGYMKDSVLANQIARRFDLRLPDLAMSLLFNENVLRDIAQKCGGNPFDNTNTVYSGFPDDYLLNKKVERLPAVADPDKIFAQYDRTGNIGKPVVLMHTVYDQLIPPTYGVVNFENMVHQRHKDRYLSVFYTNGQGHCQFTPEQTAKAFDSLRAWLKTGQKPVPRAVE